MVAKALIPSLNRQLLSKDSRRSRLLLNSNICLPQIPGKSLKHWKREKRTIDMWDRCSEAPPMVLEMRRERLLLELMGLL